MRRIGSVFVRAYGAHPLHLLAMLASFAVAAYAAVRVLPSDPVWIAVWFVGAAVAHDLVLLPLYAIADTALVRSVRLHNGGAARAAAALPRVPWVNYVRVPALVSALLLLVWFPSVFRLSDVYPRYSALSSDSYLERWLLVTAALFVLSAFAYAVALRRARPSRQDGPRVAR